MIVAKEYVAAKDPSNPGVLILSEFAGAAKQLDNALLVNPHDIDDVAKKLVAAFTMPAEERRERWGPMVKRLRGSSVRQWFSQFIETLADTRLGPVHVPFDWGTAVRGTRANSLKHAMTGPRFPGIQKRETRGF